MNFVIAFLVGIAVGSAITLGAPYHRHDWTKWEHRTVRVNHYYSVFGKVKDMGQGVETEEYRNCTKCGKYQERYVD